LWFENKKRKKKVRKKRTYKIYGTPLKDQTCGQSESMREQNYRLTA
jgi:hypothetical protein